MTTVADVLMLFENLLNGEWNTKREAQRCLRDICEEHGCESLRALISGHYFTYTVTDGSGDTQVYGPFRTEVEAKTDGDKEAFNLLFRNKPQPPEPFTGKAPGYWIARYNEVRDGWGAYIAIEIADNFLIPFCDDEISYSDLAPNLGVLFPPGEDQ